MRNKREMGQNGRPIRTCPDSWKVIIKKILNLVDAKEILQIYKNRYNHQNLAAGSTELNKPRHLRI